MKIFDLNLTQIALLGTQEEMATAEAIMAEGGKYTTSITIAGNMVKAFVWGISDETKNKLYALCGEGQGIKVAGVEPDTFKMPEKEPDPKLQESVDQAMQTINQEQIVNVTSATEPVAEQVSEEASADIKKLNMVKAVSQNATTYCLMAFGYLYNQLYNQTPDVNSQEFKDWINNVTAEWMNMAQHDVSKLNEWYQWIDYIYRYGTEVYKQANQQ